MEKRERERERQSKEEREKKGSKALRLCLREWERGGLI